MGVIEGISHLPGRKTVRWLIKWLQRDPKCRQYTIDVLADLAAHEAAPAVRRALEDESEDVRGAASHALGRLRDARRKVRTLEGADS